MAGTGAQAPKPAELRELAGAAEHILIAQPGPVVLRSYRTVRCHRPNSIVGRYIGFRSDDPVILSWIPGSLQDFNRQGRKARHEMGPKCGNCMTRISYHRVGWWCWSSGLRGRSHGDGSRLGKGGKKLRIALRAHVGIPISCQIIVWLKDTTSRFYFPKAVFFR